MLIPVQLLVALVAALVLDNLATRISRFSRLMIFVPYAIPVVIGAMMWGFLYSSASGPPTRSSACSAPTPRSCYPDNVFGGLLNVVVWQWAGYYMIIIYAALRGIDPSIYEAARIDGANGLQTATRIKLPMISSSMVIVIMFALIGTLQFFTEPVLLRSDRVDRRLVHPEHLRLHAGVLYCQFNYASAISFALGALVFVGSSIFLFLTRKQSGLS